MVASVHPCCSLGQLIVDATMNRPLPLVSISTVSCFSSCSLDRCPTLSLDNRVPARPVAVAGKRTLPDRASQAARTAILPMKRNADPSADDCLTHRDKLFSLIGALDLYEIVFRAGFSLPKLVLRFSKTSSEVLGERAQRLVQMHICKFPLSCDRLR